MSIKKITLIGLGAMGTSMAAVLLEAGYRVSGFDIIRNKMANLVSLGLEPADSLRESVKGADLVILTLKSGSIERSDWDVTREVVERKKGIREALKRGQIVVDTSTAPPWESRAMGERLAKKGVAWMDVPISEAAFQARKGNMVFMAGGKKSVFNKIKPVLDRLGKKVFYAGRCGAGAQLKVIVSQTLLLNQGSAIEGFVHGMKGGLNPEAMYEVLASGAAGSEVITAKGKAMLAGKFGGEGTVRGALKDIELALESARRLGVMLPMAALYHQLILQACYRGWEMKDATVVMRVYEQLAGMDRKRLHKPQEEAAGHMAKRASKEIKNISVIGLGAMGTPMATFLLKAGYRVSGYDLIAKQISNLVPLGLKPMKSCREAAAGADLILLSLRSWGAIKEVVEGKEGILKAGGRPGLIIVDASTVTPWDTKAMAERLAPLGIMWMDVPVSGSAKQAREGNMVFMAGGEKAVFEKIKPILDQVGKKTIYVGKNGDAAMLKLIVNQVLYLNQASAMEGFVHGLKAGIEPEAIYEAMVSGAAGSDLIAARGKDMLGGNFESKGPLSARALDLALENARRSGVMLPLSALFVQLILQALYNGWAGSDGTVVMKVYEQLAGIKKKAA